MPDVSRFVWDAGGPRHVWNSYQDMLDDDAANPEVPVAVDLQPVAAPQPGPPKSLRRSYRSGKRTVLRHNRSSR